MKKDIHMFIKRLMYGVKRDIYMSLLYEKSPTCIWKVSYINMKKDMYMYGKRPLHLWKERERYMYMWKPFSASSGPITLVCEHLKFS